jgi:hypothetical protein
VYLQTKITSTHKSILAVGRQMLCSYGVWRVYQSQWRPGTRHVAVVESPALCLFVLSLSPHVFTAEYVTALGYPYVTALLQDQTIVLHNVESQEAVQTELPSPGKGSICGPLASTRAARARRAEFALLLFGVGSGPGRSLGAWVCGCAIFLLVGREAGCL